MRDGDERIAGWCRGLMPWDDSRGEWDERWVGWMKGQRGCGGGRERLVGTHMLESGHAQLPSHKMYKVLVC